MPLIVGIVVFAIFFLIALAKSNSHGGYIGLLYLAVLMMIVSMIGASILQMYICEKVQTFTTSVEIYQLVPQPDPVRGQQYVISSKDIVTGEVTYAFKIVEKSGEQVDYSIVDGKETVVLFDYDAEKASGSLEVSTRTSSENCRWIACKQIHEVDYHFHLPMK